MLESASTKKLELSELIPLRGQYIYDPNEGPIIQVYIEGKDLKKYVIDQKQSIKLSRDLIPYGHKDNEMVKKIAENMERKGQFAGMHWWNPPHLIPLVEVIKGDQTTEETATLVINLSTRVGKKAVLVLKDAPGFIGNRLQFALFREAIHIVEQGIASPEDVDMAMKMGLGFRLPIIGPFETADLGGLDTFLAISSYLFKEISSQIEPSILLPALYKFRVALLM